MNKRILAWLLTLALVISLMPAAVFADEQEDFFVIEEAEDDLFAEEAEDVIEDELFAPEDLEEAERLAAAETVALADGTYKATGLTTAVLSMYHFHDAKVVIKGEDAWLITTEDTDNTVKRFDGMAYGPQSQILDSSDETNHTLVEGTVTARVAPTYQADGTLLTRTMILPVPKSVIEAGQDIYYMIKYVSGYSDTHDGDWYKASGGDYYLTGYTLEKVSDSTLLPDVTEELTVDNKVRMFLVEDKAVLETCSEPESEEREAILKIMMSNDTFSEVFLGSADQAAEAAADDLITISDRIVPVPVETLIGKKFLMSFHSSKGWYERLFLIDDVDKTLTILPVGKAKVDFTSTLSGGFLHAPATNYEVLGSEAEKYGYFDDVDGVSALDVLVAAHELVYEDAFTPETAEEYLTLEYGNPKMQFGVPSEDAYGMFFMNHAAPNTGVWVSDEVYGGYYKGYYLGTIVSTQEVKDGDLLEFFFAEDDYGVDMYNWFVDTKTGEYNRNFTVCPGEDIELTLKGITTQDLFAFKDEEDMVATERAAERTWEVGDAQIYLVNKETGDCTEIEDAITDEDEGTVTLNFTEPGEYLITAYGTEYTLFTQILSLTTITVGHEAMEPVEEVFQVTYNEHGHIDTVVYCSVCNGEVERTVVETEKALKDQAAEAAAAAAAAIEEAAALSGEDAVEPAAAAAEAAAAAQAAAQKAYDAAVAEGLDVDVIAEAQNALDAASEAAVKAEETAKEAEKAAEEAADIRDAAIVALAQLDSLVNAKEFTASTYGPYATAYDNFKKLAEDSGATAAQFRAARSAVTKAYLALEKKAAQPMTVKASTKNVSLKKVKKANQTVKGAITVQKNQGKVTYKKSSGNSKITINSSGKITVKKGLKKGTYKIKVKVTAAGNDNYKSGSKTVTVTIKVK